MKARNPSGGTLRIRPVNSHGRVAMALESSLVAMIDPALKSKDDLSAAVFAACWPGDSAFSGDVQISVEAGEDLESAADRLDLAWNPRWLTDAGYRPTDAAGTDLTHEPARVSGVINWSPEVRMCRVDDQSPDAAPKTSAAYRRRIAGEVALLALWTRAADGVRGLTLSDRADITGNTRGARLKHILVHVLSKELPDGWTVLPEVPLTHIRGLHMRKDVSGRKSDIIVLDEDRRLVAVISSKWTWRSDRGTEAAQMVPLKQYRPDVPYALVTAEFPRATSIARESVEDRTYHVCPDWVAAWLAINAPAPRVRHDNWPDLDAVAAAGRLIRESLFLEGLDGLVTDLSASGSIL